MPSFSFPSPTTTGGVISRVGPSFESIHDTVLSYVHSLFPPSFNDALPFLLAGFMALVFTALLVLFVEDSEDAYPHSPRSQSTNSSSTVSPDEGKRRTKRLIGLAEQDSDSAERHTDDEEWSTAWDPREDGRDDLKTSMEWTKRQNDKNLNLHPGRYRIANSKLLASPPSSASRTSSHHFSPILFPRFPLHFLFSFVLGPWVPVPETAIPLSHADEEIPLAMVTNHDVPMAQPFFPRIDRHPYQPFPFHTSFFSGR